MMRRRSGFRGAWICGGALLVLGAMAAGCGRPPDEAWLRFLGFKQGTTTISVLEDNLREENTVTVDADFENKSLYVGQKSGAGILVNRARIDYRMAGFSPPSAEYPLNLYLAPPADGAATTGTLSAFPLVSTALKEWLINTGAFDDAASDPVVELTARVTFFGETDDGAALETEGSIRIELTNTGGGSTGTLPAVHVLKTADASKTGADGTFTVYRSGSDAANLTVAFNTDIFSTATSGVDYVSIGSSVTIPAGAGSKTITVEALAASTVGETVKINLTESASYTLEAGLSSAVLSIIP